MIVPMKKIAVVMQSKDALSTINKLGALGVVHVENQRLPESKDINTLREEIVLTDNVINILQTRESVEKIPRLKQEEPKDWRFTAKHIVDLNNRYDQLKGYKKAMANTIGEWESWGDFNPETIKALADKGIYVRLYQVSAREIKLFPPSVIVKKLSTVKGVTNCAVISRKKIDIPFKELSLPKTSIAKMRARLAENDKIIDSIKEEMLKHTRFLGSFKCVKKSLQKNLEFQEALNGMGEKGSIVYLTGYTPYDATKSLLERAKKEKWGISIKDPSPEDRVPTLIRNPRLISIIAPVFKVIEIIPGYHELDISLWFLIFLSIFFGMLIGDAGYGIIFFALTLFFHRKLGNKMPNKAPFILFYTLSLFAIVWGVLTGTFFGQGWLTGLVKPLMPALRDSKNIQALCFLIGAIHLSIAHLWRALIKLPSPKALSDIGWVSVLWGAFFLAKTLILGESFPTFGKWFFIIGPGLVIVFTDLNRNIFKSIASGLGNLLLNVVNSFTDVVSYIRLFAVGLATVAIADAFNKMAMGIGYNSFLTGLATSLILLVGHALNILLGPLAVLVHGVRLNVLEFCNHLDIKWSGFLYKPLKEERN